ncbi:MAG: Crp/Fnr family transcriptional regulator [Calditrichaeota bacterium]|nr:MAG: Crp/Fnr family transcriptional regulator [Calditrichota bacterium]
MKLALHKIFPQWESMERNLKEEIKEYSYIRRFHSSQLFVIEGEKCNSFYVVLEGSVKVFKTSELGKEITIYNVSPMESCLLTSFSIVNNQPFIANAQALKHTLLLLFPKNKVLDWLNRYESWREFYLNSCSSQLFSLISKIESLVFQRVDERIANFLASAVSSRVNSLQMTHSEVAREVGTAREVVSRILKEFENEDLIRLSRGKIEIINPERLSVHGKLYPFAG